MSMKVWIEPTDAPVPMPVTDFGALPHVVVKTKDGRKVRQRTGLPMLDRPKFVDLQADGAYWLRRCRQRGKVNKRKAEVRVISEAEAKKKLAALEAPPEAKKKGVK
jgi:hypothetical protein